MNYLLLSVVALCILHVTVADEILYAKVGEDVRIDLPSSTNYLYWFLKSVQIASVNSFGRADIDQGWTNRLSVTKERLVIKNITQDIFGTFSCEVRNKHKNVVETKYYKLIQLTVSVNSPILLPGQLLSLTCNTASQNDRPRIYWMNPQGVKERREGGTLSIQSTTRLHSGQWTCVIESANKKETNIKVTVIDLLPPAPVPTRYTSKSSSLSIPCSIPSDITWDNVKTKGVQEVGWYFCPASTTNHICNNKLDLFSLVLEDKLTWKALKDTTLRPASNPGKGDLSLGRSLWREGDIGDYVCFMKFQDSVILNRTVRVEVLQIIASPGTELTSGELLNLTCTTGHPLTSDLRVKWISPKKDGDPLIHDHHSPHLTVPEVGRDHKGTWRCELWRGETLLTSAVVALNIEPKISSWMLATIGAAAVVLVLLVILIVILHRRRQRRTRRHKLRLCKCKNPKPKGFYRS